MLMSKYTFSVEIKTDGAYSTVTRISDGVSHTFFNAGHTRKSDMESLLRSITDDQAESYFPKPRKK